MRLKETHQWQSGSKGGRLKKSTAGSTAKELWAAGYGGLSYNAAAE